MRGCSHPASSTVRTTTSRSALRSRQRRKTLYSSFSKPFPHSQNLSSVRPSPPPPTKSFLETLHRYSRRRHRPPQVTPPLAAVASRAMDLCSRSATRQLRHRDSCCRPSWISRLRQDPQLLCLSQNGCRCLTLRLRCRICRHPQYPWVSSWIYPRRRWHLRFRPRQNLLSCVVPRCSTLKVFIKRSRVRKRREEVVLNRRSVVVVAKINKGL